MTCQHGRPMLAACPPCGVDALDAALTPTGVEFARSVEGKPLVYSEVAS